MASQQLLTHSTLKGPLRESTSERRTAFASAASARMRSRFRGIVLTHHCALRGCAEQPAGLCASAHAGHLPVWRSVAYRTDARSAVHHAVTLGMVSQTLHPGELRVTAFAAHRGKSSARRSTPPGSAALAGTLRAGGA